jgi:hypothetical protein
VVFSRLDGADGDLPGALGNKKGSYRWSVEAISPPGALPRISGRASFIAFLPR